MLTGGVSTRPPPPPHPHVREAPPRARTREPTPPPKRPPNGNSPPSTGAPGQGAPSTRFVWVRLGSFIDRPCGRVRPGGSSGFVRVRFEARLGGPPIGERPLCPPPGPTRLKKMPSYPRCNHVRVHACADPPPEPPARTPRPRPATPLRGSPRYPPTTPQAGGLPPPGARLGGGGFDPWFVRVRLRPRPPWTGSSAAGPRVGLRSRPDQVRWVRGPWAHRAPKWAHRPPGAPRGGTEIRLP
jgi:hypothetical protein